MRARETEVVASLSEERLWARLMEFATFGATPAGGVNRSALSEPEIELRRSICDWAASRGMKAYHDAIGNFFVRRDGERSDLRPVLVGSHLDSQPTGGRFDGAYGVAAGYEMLDVLCRTHTPTLRPIEVVAWMNEEGSSFSPGAMGSSVYAGVRDFAAMAARTDRSGTRVGDLVQRTLDRVGINVVPSPATRAPRAYIEAHIEQGPILEAENLPVGVVTGIQGIRRIDVTVTGTEAHAGTTPRSKRRDALLAATTLIGEMRELAEDAEDVFRFTVGRLETWPGTPSTVPGRVHFTVDMRHPEEAVLHRVSEAVCERARTPVTAAEIEISDISYVRPTHFAEEVPQLLRRACDEFAIRFREMPSGAGHDAMYLSRICPTGMVFVPCRDGVSHHESESARPEHLALGARAAMHAALVLAQSAD